MHGLTKPSLMVTFTLGGLAAPLCMGQTPVPAPAPSITMPWLACVSVDRAKVFDGDTVRGTVTLLRPAVKPIVVGVTVFGTVTMRPLNKDPLSLPRQHSQQVMSVPATLTVPAGSSSATFEIRPRSRCNAHGLPVGDPCPATYGVVVEYGSERRDVGFAVSGEPCI